jgi:hypothetical protein
MNVPLMLLRPRRTRWDYDQGCRGESAPFLDRRSSTPEIGREWLDGTCRGSRRRGRGHCRG